MDAPKVGDKVRTQDGVEGTVAKLFKNGLVSVEIGTEKKHKKLHVKPEVLTILSRQEELPIAQ